MLLGAVRFWGEEGRVRGVHGRARAGAGLLKQCISARTVLRHGRQLEEYNVAQALRVLMQDRRRGNLSRPAVPPDSDVGRGLVRIVRARRLILRRVHIRAGIEQRLNTHVEAVGVLLPPHVPANNEDEEEDDKEGKDSLQCRKECRV